ncbi:MAG TPA: ubiquinone/menaquinone biosynthesis methyltransferase [Phycisphaerae bacterium]|nr:ubiquinone/menaquinone biosynthesis methyltransferase [Phycisphaerae bacterium]
MGPQGELLRPRRPPVWDRVGLRHPHAQSDKAGRVRRMFDAIAGTYELVNTLTSLGRDAYWRRQAVALAALRDAELVLDVACGTGDLARAFAAARRGAVVGVDFAERMLALAVGRGGPGQHWCLGDAMHLPFAAGTFSVVSCAFGVRNFQDVRAGLADMHRVLQPGGRAVILEFSLPKQAAARALYRLYFEGLMPIAAMIVSRDRGGAYRYLPKSVVSFLDRRGLATALHEVGFERVTTHALTSGVVVVCVAWKAIHG